MAHSALQLRLPNSRTTTASQNIGAQWNAKETACCEKFEPLHRNQVLGTRSSMEFQSKLNFWQDPGIRHAFEGLTSFQSHLQTFEDYVSTYFNGANVSCLWGLFWVSLEVNIPRLLASQSLGVCKDHRI